MTCSGDSIAQHRRHRSGELKQGVTSDAAHTHTHLAAELHGSAELRHNGGAQRPYHFPKAERHICIKVHRVGCDLNAYQNEKGGAEREGSEKEREEKKLEEGSEEEGKKEEGRPAPSDEKRAAAAVSSTGGGSSHTFTDWKLLRTCFRMAFRRFASEAHTASRK
jgi:hypothetical protein